MFEICPKQLIYPFRLIYKTIRAASQHYLPFIYNPDESNIFMPD